MRVLIFSHGKTGSTALAYRLHAALPDHALIFEPASLPQDAQGNVVVKYFPNVSSESAQALAGFDKRILLVRHPFDFVISWVLYIPVSLPALTVARRATEFVEAVKKCECLGTGFAAVFRKLSEVARLTEADLLFQLANLLDIVRANDLPFHLVKYESLIANDLGALEDFLGCALPDSLEVDPRHGHVSRTRAEGNWRHWFDADDIAYFGSIPVVREYAAMFGYDLFVVPEKTQCRDPAAGSRYVQAGIERNCARAGLVGTVDVAVASSDAESVGSQLALEESFIDVIRGERTGDRQLASQSAMLCLVRGFAVPPVLLSAAKYMYELGQFSVAALAAERAAAGMPESVAAWHQLALAQSSLGNIPLALQAASQVCALEPTIAANFRHIGSLHGALGQWPEAERAYDAGAQLGGGDASLYRFAAAAMWEQGRSEDALAYLAAAITKYPDAWELPFMAAHILFASRRDKEAMAMATDAVALTDSDTPVKLLRQIASRRGPSSTWT